MTVFPSIADRIAIAIGRDGCELRILRENLSDLEPAPLDYALQGLVTVGRVTILDGYIRLAIPVQHVPYRPSLLHPWKRLPVVQRARR